MAGLRRRVCLAFLVLAASCVGPSQGEELRGVALVVGQADYATISDLRNPGNDAHGIHALLDDLGFEVTPVLLDSGGSELRAAIERFLAVAKGADVALVYYAGHAVEVAGQNYLVPVDADLSNPAVAGEGLIPAADLLDRLAREVPVTILLLDACRSDPFPEGTAVLLPETTTPAVLGDGLVEMRGPIRLSTEPGPDSLAIAIGFASAPGSGAGDGPPGGHSPYAAALLKHLRAGGYTFDQLMQLVTEEVYVTTRGAQSPWVNSTVRRELTFGAPLEAAGDEQTIRDGRRKLLFSIAQVPAAVRQQVERAATGGGVPIAALYGYLDAQGVELPNDPQALSQLLKQQAAVIGKVMAERRALEDLTHDPEIVRLTSLARAAFDEGAYAASTRWWEEAIAYYQREIRPRIDAEDVHVIAALQTGADLMVAAADNQMVVGDYAAAATNYGLAFAEVRGRDAERERTYKAAEAHALKLHGLQRGGDASLEQAIGAYRYALILTPREAVPDQWAKLQNELGNALRALGGLDGLHEAVAAHSLALDVIDRADAPFDWAVVQRDLGHSRRALGELEGDRGEGLPILGEAIDSYREALSVFSLQTSPLDWAETQKGLAGALYWWGARGIGLEPIEEAIAIYRELLGTVYTREGLPDDWAETKLSIAEAVLSLSTYAEEPAPAGEKIQRVESAIASYREVLGIYTRDAAPFAWARTTRSLADRLAELGELHHVAGLEDAIQSYRDALVEYPRDTVPMDWAAIQVKIGDALQELAELNGGDPDLLEEAVLVYRLALEELTTDRATSEVASTHFSLAEVLLELALTTSSSEHLKEAQEAGEAAEEADAQSDGEFAENYRLLFARIAAAQKVVAEYNEDSE